jgi:hypothetical protein
VHACVSVCGYVFAGDETVERVCLVEVMHDKGVCGCILRAHLHSDMYVYICMHACDGMYMYKCVLVPICVCVCVCVRR